MNRFWPKESRKKRKKKIKYTRKSFLTFCKHFLFRIAPKFHIFLFHKKKMKIVDFRAIFRFFSILRFSISRARFWGPKFQIDEMVSGCPKIMIFFKIEFFAFLSTPNPGEQFLIIFRTIRAVSRKLRPICEGPHFFVKKSIQNGKEKSAVKYVLP